MTNSPRYCWDTSVFIAWLNREKSAPLAEIDCLVDEINSKKAILVVSVVTYMEMLRAKHSDEQIATFDLFLQRSNVVRVDVTFPVAQKAEQIRSRGLQLFPKGQKRSIKTADATIIATAIIYKAHVLHSLEPVHHNLSKSPVVDNLVITSPKNITGQQVLNLQSDDD